MPLALLLLALLHRRGERGYLWSRIKDNKEGSRGLLWGRFLLLSCVPGKAETPALTDRRQFLKSAGKFADQQSVACASLSLTAKRFYLVELLLCNASGFRVQHRFHILLPLESPGSSPQPWGYNPQPWAAPSRLCERQRHDRER